MPTDLDIWRSVAEAIISARRTGSLLGRVPPPMGLSEGYSVAALVARGLGEIAGWKVGATSPGAQAFLGVDEPIYGRVFAGSLWESGSDLDLPGERAAEAEPEIIVRLGRDPLHDLDRGDIAAFHIGLEINRPSCDDALGRGAAFIVADNSANVGLVIGPAIGPEALERPDQLNVRLMRDGETISQGNATAVLGNPLEALRWLVRARSGTERPLRAGDWIATGAMARSAAFARGDRIQADFGQHGSLSISRRAQRKVMSSDCE